MQSTTVDYLSTWPDLAVVPQCSLRYGHRQFPSRQDYETALIEAGVVLVPEQLWANPPLVAAIQRHWHKTGQSGCLFARLLARRMSKQAWPVIVVRGVAWRTDSTLGIVEDLLAAAAANPVCEIVSVLVPGVVSIPTLKELVETFASHRLWSMQEHHEHSEEILLELRRPVAVGGALAWIMAFGPFSQWPPTRQGPVTEFAIRVKPKPANLFHALNQDPSAAHLADTETGLSTAQTETLFVRTSAATRDVLGADPNHRSAARTTFSFLATDWSAA